jgi:hypothetical protein
MIKLEGEMDERKRPKNKMQESRQTERKEEQDSKLKKTRMEIPVLN